MCLAIPGKVLSAFNQNGLRMAKVQFGGIVREACLEYVPETQIGDYVLVHVGFAMAKIDEREAAMTLDQVQKMGADYVNEIEAFNASEIA